MEGDEECCLISPMDMLYIYIYVYRYISIGLI